MVLACISGLRKSATGFSMPSQEAHDLPSLIPQETSSSLSLPRMPGYQPLFNILQWYTEKKVQSASLSERREIKGREGVGVSRQGAREQLRSRNLWVAEHCHGALPDYAGSRAFSGLDSLCSVQGHHPWGWHNTWAYKVKQEWTG